jgi:hypothetical protein
MADNRSKVFKDKQEEFVQKANETDTYYVENILEPNRKKIIEMEKRLSESKDAEIEIQKANELRAQTASDYRAAVDALEAEQAKPDSERDETEIAKLSDDLDKTTKIMVEAKDAAIEVVASKSALAGRVGTDEAALQDAQIEMRQVEESDAVKNNVAYQMVDSSKRAEGAKASYEAAVARASRGLTSEVNLQKASQSKDLADSQLEMDKSTRLAQDREIKNVDTQIRATKERTVNINREVNVDYADTIKKNTARSVDNPSVDIATYAGGGRAYKIDGSSRRDDDLATVLAQGAAEKTVDSDVADRNSNIRAYLSNNPSEWHRVSEIALKNKSASIGTTIISQLAETENHEEASELYQTLTSDHSIMSDPEQVEIIYGNLLADKKFTSGYPLGATHAQLLAKEAKTARKTGKSIKTLSYIDAMADPSSFDFMQKNLSKSKVQGWEYDDLEGILKGLQSGDPTRETAARNVLNQVIVKYADAMTVENKSLADVVELHGVMELNRANPGAGQTAMRESSDPETVQKERVDDMKAIDGWPAGTNPDGTLIPPRFKAKNPGSQAKFDAAEGNGPGYMVATPDFSAAYQTDGSFRNRLSAYAANLNSPNPRGYEGEKSLQYQREVLTAAGFVREHPGPDPGTGTGKWVAPPAPPLPTPPPSPVPPPPPPPPPAAPRPTPTPTPPAPPTPPPASPLGSPFTALPPP